MQIPEHKAHKYSGSRVIGQSSRYVASITKAGLIVQHHQSGKGALMPPDHKYFADYVESLENPLDTSEFNALCRAFLN